MPPKPGQLPFGITAGRLLNLRDAFALAKFSRQSSAESHASRAFVAPLRQSICSARTSSTTPLANIIFHAAIDAFVKFVAIAKDKNAARLCALRGSQSALLETGLPVSRQISSARINASLDSAGRSSAPHSDRASGRRMNNSSCAELTQPFAQFRIRRRQRREPMSQRLNVKTAAADDDRRFSARCEFPRSPRARACEIFPRSFLRVSGTAPIKWCGTFASVCPIRFGREQIEPAINLESVRADNFRVARARNFCRDLGFSRRSRSDDEENALSFRRTKKPGDRALCLPVSKTRRIRLFVNFVAWCSLDFAPLTTSLRPRNSLSCNSLTARFASSTVSIWTKAKPFERWLCL